MYILYMIITSVIHNWNIVESGVKRNNHISDILICNHNGKTRYDSNRMLLRKVSQTSPGFFPCFGGHFENGRNFENFEDAYLLL